MQCIDSPKLYWCGHVWTQARLLHPTNLVLVLRQALQQLQQQQTLHALATCHELIRQAPHTAAHMKQMLDAIRMRLRP